MSCGAQDLLTVALARASRGIVTRSTLRALTTRSVDPRPECYRWATSLLALACVRYLTLALWQTWSRAAEDLKSSTHAKCLVSCEVGGWPSTSWRGSSRELGRTQSSRWYSGVIGACPYGVRDRIWDEDPITSFGLERAVTYTWLRWEELLEAEPTDLPLHCSPDEAGITWMNLWDY